MNRLVWLIWDAASYNLVDLLIKDDKLFNLQSILRKGVGIPVSINKYNTQTPYALAVQFTGKTGNKIEMGGYDTPRFKGKDDDLLEYDVSFKNKKVKKYLFWKSHLFKNKFISLGQIPYSDSSQNNFRLIDGFSRKLFSKEIFYSSRLTWTINHEGCKKTELSLFNRIFIIKECNTNTYELIDSNTGTTLLLEKDSFIGRDFWLDDFSGCKIFIFSTDNDIVFFFSDVFKYTTNNIEINESFKKSLGVFFWNCLWKII